MRLHVYRVVLALLLWSAAAFAQGPQSLYFPGPSGSGGSGNFHDLHAGPGAISVTGGSGNGSDQISNLNVNGVINPMSFGAKCDGVTDDRASLNNALAACGTATGTMVEIPNLVCATSNTIYVPSNCTLRGRGPHSQILEMPSAALPPWPGGPQVGIIQNANSSTGNNNVAVRDLTIMGQHNAAKAGDCIILTRVTNADIDNVTCSNNDLLGVLIESSSAFKVRNSHFVSPNQYAVTIYNTYSVSQNFSITNNLTENTGGDSIFVALTPVPSGAGSVVTGSTDFSIIGNIVRNAGDAGIEVGAVGNLGVQHTNFVVNNNTVDGSVNNGILLRNVAHFAVTGNTLRNNGSSDSAGQFQDEISVYPAEGNDNDGTIVGNHMWPTWGSGVGFGQGGDLAGNVYTASHIVVSANEIVFPTKTFTCTNRNGAGIDADLHATGAANAQQITIVGNNISGLPCGGISAIGISPANYLAGATIQGNSIAGQNQTTTNGISCQQASCNVTGNLLVGLNTGVTFGNAVSSILSGNQFLGAINTGYSFLATNTFQPFDVRHPVGLGKLGAAPTVFAGGGDCEMFAVAGTNPGTCKIQAICGTSLTPVTIVDNVGGSC